MNIYTVASFGNLDIEEAKLKFKELLNRDERIWFRGIGEAHSLRLGYVSDRKGDAIEFWNGHADVMNSQRWVYPIMQLEIAL